MHALNDAPPALSSPPPLKRLRHAEQPDSTSFKTRLVASTVIMRFMNLPDFKITYDVFFDLILALANLPQDKKIIHQINFTEAFFKKFYQVATHLPFSSKQITLLCSFLFLSGFTEINEPSFRNLILELTKFPQLKKYSTQAISDLLLIHAKLELKNPKLFEKVLDEFNRRNFGDVEKNYLREIIWSVSKLGLKKGSNKFVSSLAKAILARLKQFKRKEIKEILQSFMSFEVKDVTFLHTLISELTLEEHFYLESLQIYAKAGIESPEFLEKAQAYFLRENFDGLDANQFIQLLNIFLAFQVKNQAFLDKAFARLKECLTAEVIKENALFDRLYGLLQAENSSYRNDDFVQFLHFRRMTQTPRIYQKKQKDNFKFRICQDEIFVEQVFLESDKLNNALVNLNYNSSFNNNKTIDDRINTNGCQIIKQTPSLIAPKKGDIVLGVSISNNENCSDSVWTFEEVEILAMDQSIIREICFLVAGNDNHL